MMTMNMWKKAVFCCVAACAAIFLLSCELGGNKINGPVDIRYIVENPVSIYDVSESQEVDGVLFEGHGIQISGLKDLKVEEKINQLLKNIYAQYEPGVIPEEASDSYPDMTCARQSIRLQCSGNFNNVISVRASYYWEYTDENVPEEVKLLPFVPAYYEISEAYTLDLNSGEEITLEEVFADNAEYADLIKTALTTRLEYEGIALNEKDLNQSIEQYLTDPHFALGNTYLEIQDIQYPDSALNMYTLILPFNENFAITKRFFNPENSIYTGDLVGKKTLLTYVGEMEGWEDGYIEEGIIIYLRGSYQKDFPEDLREIILAEGAADKKRIEEMKTILKEQAGGSAQAFYSRDVTTSKVQDFINVRTYENISIYAEKKNTSYLDRNHQTLECYQMGNPEPVTLRTLFKEEVDVEGLLERLVQKKLEGDQRLLEESGYERTMDVAAQARGAADKITGFCVNSESIFAEYQGDSALPSYVIELKYEDIGYENLKMFE